MGRPANRAGGGGACRDCVDTGGQSAGAGQPIDTLAALRAISIDAPWTYHEEQGKGSIEPGKWTAFMIIDRNPLSLPSKDLRSVRLVASVKEDRLIFTSDGSMRQEEAAHGR